MKPRRARENVAVAVLAAGQSKRFGTQNKLLHALPNGQSLIGQIVDLVNDLDCSSRFAVLGWEAVKTKAAFDTEIQIIENEDFEKGFTTSLASAVLNVDKETLGLLIVLGDMPTVQPETMQGLIDAFVAKATREAVVPTHKGKWGNPVLIGRHFFAQLLELQGDKGARDLLRAHPELVLELPVEDQGILVDVDTPDDLDFLGSLRSHKL